MHELMACTASIIILTLFILQTAANTNTFIEAVYCEKTVSEYVSEEYGSDEMAVKMKEMKDELERMPGVRAELNENTLDLYLEGAIGPAKALGISDGSLHIKKELEFREKAVEDEEHDPDSGDTDDTGASEQDTDGDERADNFDDMTNITEG